MLRKTIKWLAWVTVVVTLVFVICAFSALNNWFDQSTADMITWYSAYVIFILGLALLGCYMFDKPDEEEALE